MGLELSCALKGPPYRLIQVLLHSTTSGQHVEGPTLQLLDISSLYSVLINIIKSVVCTRSTIFSMLNDKNVLSSHKRLG